MVLQFRFAFIILLLCIAGVLICFIYIQSANSRFMNKKLHLLGADGQGLETSVHSEDGRHLQVVVGNMGHRLAEAEKPDAATAMKSKLEVPEELCPETPPHLVGSLVVTFDSPPFEEIATANPNLLSGGMFMPKDCKPRSRVAIIIPYRNREVQLRAFLHHMHPILQRQLLAYGIFIVEQSGDNKFNRALLMNIGYNESLQLSQWDCFIFHDVDLFVEDDRAPYGCAEGPRHMSGYIDKFEYKLPYAGIFGGISSIPRRHFEMVNGYSNLYFGWGGEDDDMYKRLAHKKFEISRYNRNIMRYKMWKHEHEKTNPANDRRFWLLKNTIDRMNFDGLSSLVYRRLDRKLLPTHTLVTVEVSEKELTKAVFSSRAF